MNLKIIFKVLGLLLLVEGITMLITFAIALIYGGNDILAFGVCSGINLTVGTLITLLSRKAKKDIGKREGLLLCLWCGLYFRSSEASPT